MVDVKIFVSSPGDVAIQRGRLKMVLERLGIEFSGRVRFEPTFWEEDFYGAHEGFQPQIPETANHDLVIAIFQGRLGSALPPSFPRMPTGEPYPSGSAYEVLTAIEARRCKDLPDIYVFRREEKLSAPSVEDPPEVIAQWKALKGFFERWFYSRDAGFTASFHSFADTDDFARQTEKCLRQWLHKRKILPKVVWDREQHGSPFPGLEAFESDRQSVFFGRDLAITQALGRLRQAKAPFLLLIGASGAGKSSLLRAGLLPRLVLPGVVPEIELWRPVLMAPGVNPFANLAERLLDHQTLGAELRAGAFKTPTLLASQLAVDSDAAVAPLREALRVASEMRRQAAGYATPQPARLALAIDQAERLFIEVTDETIRRRFTALLAALVRHEIAFVIMALRSDAYPKFQTHDDLLQLRENGATFDLVPPSATELEEIVTRPVLVCEPELRFEERDGQSLAARLVADAKGGDALPLLQITLSMLYAAQRVRKDDVLRFADYPGMAQAVSATASKALNKLDSAARAELPALVTGLVRDIAVDPVTGASVPIVIPLSRQAFDDSHPARQVLVETFVAERLLAAEGDAAETRVRPVHESLLRIWPAAVQIIEETAALIRTRNTLEPIVRNWREAATGDRPRHLNISAALLDGSLRLLDRVDVEATTDMREFIAAAKSVADELSKVRKAREKAERRRSALQRNAAIAASVLFVTLFVWAFHSFLDSRQSELDARRQTAAFAYRTALQEQRQGREEVALGYLAKAYRLDDRSQSIGAAILMILGNRHWPSLAIHDLVHAMGVSSAHFSPDGKQVVTASADGTAQIWDSRTGTRIGAPLRHNDVVFGARFGPNGDRVLTWSNDMTARIWDVRTGDPIGAPMRHDDWVTDGSFSKDGKLVATGSFDCSARVWSAFTGDPIGSPFQHQAWVDHVEFNSDATWILTASDSSQRAHSKSCSNGSQLAPIARQARIWTVDGETVESMQHTGGVRIATFSPDGSLILTASNDHTAVLWSVMTGKPVGTPMIHDNRVYDAAFSLDGAFVATASTDGTARVWDGHDGHAISPYMHHERDVRSVAFSPDGSRVLTASDDSTARVWDRVTGQPTGAPLRHQGAVLAAEFSPDGQSIVTASDDHTARIWDSHVGEARPARLLHGGAVYTASFSPDGLEVVTASADATVRLWDARTGKPVGSPTQIKTEALGAAFRPDGRQIVVWSRANSVDTWDVASGVKVQSLPHDAPVLLARSSPDGRRMLTATSTDGYIWDMAAAKAVHLGHYDRITSVEFSPDGKLVLLATKDHLVQLFDGYSGRRVGKPMQHIKGVNSARFSPDGRWIATASDDLTVRIWPMGSDKSKTTLQLNGAVYGAEFSPDGRRVVTACKDGTAQVWDIDSGAPVGAAMQHDDETLSAKFSPDGNWVVTASKDGTARLFDAATGVPFGMLLMHRGPVNSVEFSPDGLSLATASDDGTSRIWTVPKIAPAEAGTVANLAEAVGRISVGASATALTGVDRESEIEKLRVATKNTQPGAYLGRVMNELGLK